MEHDDLLHERINLRGEIESIRATLTERDIRYKERFVAQEEALKLARVDTKERMAGFPQEYAKKSELEVIRNTAVRLDKIAMSRDDFEFAHASLKDDVLKLLPRGEFEAILRDWTLWRNSIDAGIVERRAASTTLAKVVGFTVSVATLIITLVVLFVHHSL